MGLHKGGKKLFFCPHEVSYEIQLNHVLCDLRDYLLHGWHPHITFSGWPRGISKKRHKIHWLKRDRERLLCLLAHFLGASMTGRIRQKTELTMSTVKKITTLPARFFSRFDSFSRLSKKGSLWSVIWICFISDISEVALDNDWTGALLGGGWEKTERQLELFFTKLESGKFAVEGLCDVWPKMIFFYISCFYNFERILKNTKY